MPSVTETPPALQLEEVTRRFRAGKRVITAIDQVTAEIRRGSITGLIGPDGAGKTTLIRLCVGLLLPDSGHVRVLGLDMTASPDKAQAHIGYMPQQFGLYEDLTVQENLDLYADVQGVEPAARETRYAELLHMTGLRAFTGRLARRLSGGMKQKLGLACTLIRAPDLLFLDEPTVGVDPVSRRELWGIIDHLTRSSGMTVLLSTSYLDEAERCESVLLMHEGRLLASGSPAGFTGELSGRSFHVSAQGIGKRHLHEQLSLLPEVLDATIEGAQVRIVTHTASPPVMTFQGAETAEIVAVPPRFEDSFVALLRKQQAGAASAIAQPVIQTIAPLTERPEVIDVHELSRFFGDFKAVDRISFSVAKGEVFGLLGANGAGKSTTFRMLCGLLPPSSGTLRVAGYDLGHSAATARGRIGYMAQKFSLYADLSVQENLRFFSSAYGLKGARRQARMDWALEEFGLSAMVTVTSRDLPLGYKQRLALACALMHEPDILFLDEPTSGVDPLARREFWHRINALAEMGVTVLVTTHFMEEAEYCDRLVIMAQGRILAAGDPESLKASCRSDTLPDPTMEDTFIALMESVAEVA